MPAKDGLKDLREAVMRRCEWSATASTAATDAIDENINDALQQIALEAPFLFFEDRVRLATMSEFSSEDSTDYLTIVTDDDIDGISTDNHWVLKRSIALGAAGYSDWAEDRSWDGRLIDITDANGVVRTNRIRSIWSEGSDVFVSLWKPWPGGTYGTTNLAYRIYSAEYWLPDDVIDLKSVRVVGQSNPRLVKVISQEQAERHGLTDTRETTTLSAGDPYYCFRHGHFKLPTPNTAPVCSAEGTHKWLGPEPGGVFQYCFTIAWGKRDIDYVSPGFGDIELEDISTPATGDSPFASADIAIRNRMREPMWESSPSPASASYTQQSAVGAGSAASAIHVQFPNIEYMLGFLLNDTNGAKTYDRRHSGHSGWFLRIYRRRLSEDFDNYSELGDSISGYNIEGLSKLDIQDGFYLLAEVSGRELGGNPLERAVFTDRGRAIPDYSRRLRNVNGYQGVRFYPMPNSRKEIEFRVTRRPARMVSDNDTPPIHSEAIKLLVDYALSLTYEMMHDYTQAQVAMQRYRDGLATLKKRYADMRPGSSFTRKKATRSSRHRLVRDPLWEEPNT